MIKEFESDRPNIKLGKGKNMGSHRGDAKSLQSEVAAKVGSQYVGVAVHIQNYSPYLLTDVHKHVEYGWPEPVAGHLPKHTFHDVKPKQEEVFLFHNRGWMTEAKKRNSRGSISWQLKRSNGGNITVKSDLAPGEHFLRLQLSWDIPFKYCKYEHTSAYKDSTNKMMVQLDRTSIQHGYGEEEEQQWFERFHKNCENSHLIQGENSRVIVFSKPHLGGTKVKAEITSGCQALLTVQLIGPETDGGTNPEDDIVIDGNNHWKGKSSKTSLFNLGSDEVLIILISTLGVLGFIICLIMVIRMRKMGRAQRAQREGRTSE